MSRLRAVPETIVRRGGLRVETDPRRPSGRLLCQDDMDASYVDLADPSHLEFDYLRWTRIVLRAARARRVLHVGGGACSLARALAAEDPVGRQEVCEVDRAVLELAREYLGLRRAPGLRVRRVDGRAFVSGQGDRSWDAVVLDAYVGASVPPRLITVEALADLARVAPLVLANVVDNRSARVVRMVAAGLQEAFALVWALGGRAGNTVLAGCGAPSDLRLIAARVAADPSPARVLGPDAVARLVAGTPALRDRDVGEEGRGSRINPKPAGTGPQLLQ